MVKRLNRQKAACYHQKRSAESFDASLKTKTIRENNALSADYSHQEDLNRKSNNIANEIQKKVSTDDRTVWEIEMDAHLSNGRINISQLKDELKRKLVDFFSKYEGSKVCSLLCRFFDDQKSLNAILSRPLRPSSGTTSWSNRSAWSPSTATSSRMASRRCTCST